MKPVSRKAATWSAFLLLSTLSMLPACKDGSSGEGDAGSANSGSSAISASAPTEPAYGDALVLGTIGDASNLIRMLAGDSSSAEIAGMIFEPLITYDKTLSEFEPRLAESWEISRDGLEISFKLREDVRWTDGEPFDVHDIKFGFDTIRDPSTLTAYAEDYLQVKEMRVQGDHAFTVVYEEPYAPALGSWASIMVVLPEHILKDEDFGDTKFSRNPIGNGPYVLEDWTTGESISIISNNDYYRGRPYIDRHRWRIIPDQQTMFLELKGGGIDLMGLTPLQFKRQTDTRTFEEQFAKYEYYSNGYTYLGYNLSNPLFKDKRVRQALTHAIDRQELIDGVLLGLGTTTAVPYQPGTDWVNKDVEPWPYDPSRAKELFAEAGWKDRDGDGVLDKDGAQFSFELITNNGNEQRLKTATIIQKRLDQIGVKANIKTLEWSAFINDYINKRRFEAVILGWSMDPDPDQYIIWHSSKTGEKEFNFVGYNNPEADEVLEKGRRTFDKTERKKFYDRFQELIHEDQPYTFLYVPKSLPTVHKRFHGIDPAPAGISHNLTEWYVPTAFQKHTVTR